MANVVVTNVGTGVLGGFCFGIGLFIATVLVKALFHSGICG